MSAPAKEVKGDQLEESPSNKASSVATPAPPEMPRIYGSARGFRSNTCSNAPAIDNNPPMTKLSKALCARIAKMVFVNELDFPDRYEMRSVIPVSELPVTNASIPLTGTSNASSPSILYEGFTQGPVN